MSGDNTEKALKTIRGTIPTTEELARRLASAGRTMNKAMPTTEELARCFTRVGLVMKRESAHIDQLKKQFFTHKEKDDGNARS